MNIDYQRLASMPRDEAIRYLESVWGTGPASWAGPLQAVHYFPSEASPGAVYGYVPPGSVQANGEGYGPTDFIAPNGVLVRQYGGGDTELIPVGSYYGPSELVGNRSVPLDAGEYGNYVQKYSPTGEYKGIDWEQLERDPGWFSRNLDWLGPALVGGFATLGATGVLSGLTAAVPETVALTSTELANMGIGSIPESLTNVAATVGEGVATEAGLAGLGELGINTALTPTQLLANNAYAQALASGMSPALAAQAAEVATSLAGSGMADSAIISSALETAGATAATGAASTTGGIIGGGGSITAGLTGVAGGANPSGLAQLLNAAKKVPLKTLLQAGTIGSGILGKLLESDSKGSGDPGYMNLVTPYEMTRERNPNAQTLNSQDAYAYLRGQPSPTTGQPVSTKQQDWFNDTLTRQQTFNPVSGERYVQGATGDLLTEAQVAEAQRRLDELRAGTKSAASGGIMALARGGMAEGHLGGYSDGGRLLKGPGDGVSDSIPATIEGRQPARLADGEFVVPARIVSELGNGSTEAGARKLYAMMDRIQRGRRKTVGKKAIAKDTKAEKHLPA